MKLRIGLDFDNTLACYDEVFAIIAKEQKLIPSDWVGSKKELRDFLRTLESGELLWQKIQGKVYGKYMNQATLFPGVAEFLWKCKLNQIEVFIVSHKTEYGHFDEEKINLRMTALQWMKQKGFFDPNEFNISIENVFFFTTRSEKIEKINELELSYFIDDLIEVFEEKEFSSFTKKILFGKLEADIENIIEFDSWRKISLSIFSEFSLEEIFSVVTQKWKDLNLTEIKTLKANGNSRVYRVDSNNQSYVLKAYPDLQLDPRKRLETEYHSCSVLYQFNLPVPKPIQKDNALNWGLYLWIEGKEIDERESDLIFQLIEFIQKLKEIKNKVPEEAFRYASESCLSGVELESQIQRRLTILQNLDNSELNQFLMYELQPTLNSFLERAKSFYKEDFFLKLEEQYWILSPSDFGFHNSKLGLDGILYIYDLEYFGWDDPVKLISDFLWHPGMNLTESERVVWLENSIKIFDQDSGIENRFSMYFPLYGIRWCLILLNEFLKTKLENRINAIPEKKDKLIEIQNIQLNKSKVLLNRIKQIA
ncbi:phosphotransferase [Leptospira weilii]|uniref:Phosphotransferase enzyme domain protein n=1 Tax=Leptospira weilii str. UI 13098 TaxID=1088542 RepID=M6QBX5_9LEPT|nr:phosphotransferase [Leptospira weilii]EMN90725.1 phosphotransferase enzyme domain protein [Leptospira weilii str. UI 13098]OMI16276.1 phosphotransferase enzyme domain protein [Leptospira weilii serovar Heyan]ULH30093.1 aminoglycoside phosphotransferase family protein [Leptospira weilii]UPY78325.1 aminoglycoside phosphotransferase family protein [Leptospira weilii]